MTLMAGITCAKSSRPFVPFLTLEVKVHGKKYLTKLVPYTRFRNITIFSPQSTGKNPSTKIAGKVSTVTVTVHGSDV